MIKFKLAVAICLSVAATTIASAQQSTKLTGTVIGTAESVDYKTNQLSTTVNTIANAYDGDLETFFASYQRSFGWAGLDLGTPHVITKVGWSPRNDGVGEQRVQLAVFQGANNPDFSDALPIYLVTEQGTIGTIDYADVNCSRGFRYVRYVGPNNARCNIAEVEFYGYEGEGDDSHLFQPTNLPLVVVNTPNMEWFHDDDKNYEMEGSTITVIKDGTIDVSATGQIRGRGNASWNFPKKPFRIKFDKKQTVLGGPAKAKKWTMINNYGDKTLMRNKLAFDISKLFGMAYTPKCEFVDCIFNGEYQGCYQLCDQVEVGSGRVDITEMEETDVEGDALTGGYLIEIDAYANQEAADEWFTSASPYYIPITIKSPDPGITAQYEYIQKRFNYLQTRLSGSSFQSENAGYRRVLNLDSFLKHFLINELAGNTDTYWSTYMSLDRGADQFIVGPIWDNDLGFDNDNRTYPVNNINGWICLTKGSHANDGMRNFVSRIIVDDDKAQTRISEIWSGARNDDGLDSDMLIELVDKYAAELAASQRLNFLRWPILNTYVHQNPVVAGSYSGEVQRVRDYLTARITKMDELAGYDPDYTGVDNIETDTAATLSYNIIPGGIEITSATTFAIYSISGVALTQGSSPTTVSLSPGIYILTSPADGSATKLIISGN